MYVEYDALGYRRWNPVGSDAQVSANMESRDAHQREYLSVESIGYVHDDDDNGRKIQSIES